jgi:hypothetical protein
MVEDPRGGDFALPDEPRQPDPDAVHVAYERSVKSFADNRIDRERIRQIKNEGVERIDDGTGLDQNAPRDRARQGRDIEIELIVCYIDRVVGIRGTLQAAIDGTEGFAGAFSLESRKGRGGALLGSQEGDSPGKEKQQ